MQAPAVQVLRRTLQDRTLVAAIAGIILLGVLVLAAPGSSSAGADGARLVVADLRGHALVVLDPAQPAGARRIPLPGGPHELVRLPDGRVAVALEQYGTVALVDLGSGDVEARAVGGLPHGLDSAGGILLVTDRATNRVRRFALDPWRELEALPAGEWPHAVRALSDGRVAIANAASHTLQLGDRHADASALPETVAVAPAGDRVATAGAHGGAIQVFDLEGELIGRWQVGGRPVRVLYAPDGTLAAALSAAGAVAVVAPDGEPRVIATGGVPDGLAFSAGGERLYVGDVHSGRVTVIDVASGRVSSSFVAGVTAGALLLVE